MTPTPLFAWSVLAAFLGGAGITIVALQIPSAIQSGRHLYFHARKRPHNCEQVILGS